MSDYLWVLFGVLAIAAVVLIAGFFLSNQPKGRAPVRVDFDLYKGKEENTRFVSKGR